MNQALKRFGCLLQLLLLVFGLTAHALALDPDDASPDSLLERMAETGKGQPDWLANRPEVVSPADFPPEQPRLAEAGPYEKEEEEEVRTSGLSFKDSHPIGSASSVFFCALTKAPPGQLTPHPSSDSRPAAAATFPRRHIVLRVFRI